MFMSDCYPHHNVRHAMAPALLTGFLIRRLSHWLLTAMHILGTSPPGDSGRNVFGADLECMA